MCLAHSVRSANTDGWLVVVVGFLPGDFLWLSSLPLCLSPSSSSYPEKVLDESSPISFLLSLSSKYLPGLGSKILMTSCESSPVPSLTGMERKGAGMAQLVGTVGPGLQEGDSVSPELCGLKPGVPPVHGVDGRMGLSKVKGVWPVMLGSKR